MDASAASGCMRSSLPELLLRLLGRLLRHLGLFDLLAQFAHVLGPVVGLAQLALDGLQLLAQEIFALRLVDLAAHIGLDLLLHGEQLDLLAQRLVDALDALHRVGDLEDLLGLLHLEAHVRDGEVGKLARIVHVLDDHHDVGQDHLAEGDELLDLLLYVPHERLGLEVRLGQATSGKVLISTW